MKNKIVTIAAALAGVGMAVWGGIVFCMTGLSDTESGYTLYTLIPFWCVMVIVGMFVDEIVHEGAHFLIGCMLRMGVSLPKFRLFKSSSVEVFPKGVRGLRFRFLLTVWAGLFFDLLLALLGIMAFAVPSLPAICGMAAPYAMYSFIVNVAPLEYGQGKTDGLVALELITNRPTAQVLLAILKIQGYLHAGKQLADLDENLFFNVPQIEEDDINFIILTQLRYEYYLARGDDSKAYKYFARYKQLIHYLPDGYGIK